MAADDTPAFEGVKQMGPFRPECFTEPSPALAYLGEYGWVKVSSVSGLPRSPCNGPDEVFDRLEGGVLDESSDIRCYSGLIAANKALTNAIHRSAAS